MAGWKSCGGLHFVKKDDNDNEVIADLVADRDVGYIKLIGVERAQDSKNDTYRNLSVLNLVTITDWDPPIPKSMCARLKYDCKHGKQEGHCSHYILPNVIYTHYDSNDQRLEMKLILKLRLITQSEDPNDYQRPDLIDHCRLISSQKTKEYRSKRKDPTASYVGGDSYGDALVQGDKNAGSISVFFSTGTNLFYEHLIH